jgi:hypothetical protein
MSRPSNPTSAALGRLPIDLPLLAVLLAALLLRLALWGHLPRTQMISDEGEYLSAASWIAQGRGFAWYQEYLWTRAPLYPLFLAAHLRLFGDTLTPIVVSQTALSLANVALVYTLAKKMAGGPSPAVPTAAALLMGLYFPFALYPQMLLSETLYITLALAGFLALLAATNDQRPTTGDEGRRTENREPRAENRGQADVSVSPHPLTPSPPHPLTSRAHALVAVSGALFGLATLTRSLTLGFLPLAALWLLLRTDGRRPTTDDQPLARRKIHLFGLRRASAQRALVFVLCSALVILPWTVYNSRVFGGLVLIDTSGAFNLMLGARTAADGRRSDAPPRNFVLALARRGLSPAQREALVADTCLWRGGDPRLRAALGDAQTAPLSQARRQQMMTAEGLCLIAERPLAFAQKSLGELRDFFQINYSGDERFTDGFAIGRLPRWYSLGLFLLDDTLYVLVLPLAVLGFALARRPKTDSPASDTQGSARASFSILNSQFSILCGLWWLYTAAAAPLLFAINRFRLPLLPLGFIFAAAALAALPRGWRALRSRPGAAWAGLAALLLLVATTPYAYVWPPDPERPELPGVAVSYLGPDPSSLASTRRALASRPDGLRAEQIRAALRAGDPAEAQALLDQGDLLIARVSRRAGQVTTRELLQALIDGASGRPQQALARLPGDRIAAARDVEAAVVRGDLLRALGRTDEARAALGGSEASGFVDNANPVQWAWDWLRPVPTRRIDLAGDLDLGYIAGCYLGEGDTSLDPPATLRWCGDGAQLRFPGGGTGRAQTLALRLDDRGWAGFAAQVPPLQVYQGERLAGVCARSFAVSECRVALPPAPPGAEITVTLRTPTFIADAARYVSQQGSQVGQAQRLGARLDWAELREEMP